MSERDGGSAFPYDSKHHEPRHPGMSLRDYFAGRALTGILASHTGQDMAMPPSDVAADNAYSYADAMLKAREQS